jgi:hypothetical protein
MSLFSFSFSRGDATSKPVKKVKAPKGSKLNSLHKSLKVNKSKCLTGVVDFREAVKVPPGEDSNEWVATNGTISFVSGVESATAGVLAGAIGVHLWVQ